MIGVIIGGIVSFVLFIIFLILWMGKWPDKPNFNWPTRYYNYTNWNDIKGKIVVILCILSFLLFIGFMFGTNNCNSSADDFVWSDYTWVG